MLVCARPLQDLRGDSSGWNSSGTEVCIRMQGGGSNTPSRTPPGYDDASREQNRTRIASMRASETLHVKLHKNRKNKEVMANARTRTLPVEGAIASFHSEVKLGPCTSVLRIVTIINTVYISSFYTIFRIAHQSTFILHVFINDD